MTSSRTCPGESPSTILLIHKLAILTHARRSPDGQSLMLSSRDGYCTLVVFDEILPAHHTQQHTLQLQSIAHHHALPLTNSNAGASSTMATPLSTPSMHAVGLPAMSPVTPLPAPLPLPLSGSVLGKRSAEPPLTPAASVDAGEALELGDAASVPPPSDEVQEPPKKKRRAVLTRVSELDP